MNDPFKYDSLWYLIIATVGLVMFWIGVWVGLELAEVDRIIII